MLCCSFTARRATRNFSCPRNSKLELSCCCGAAAVAGSESRWTTPCHPARPPLSACLGLPSRPPRFVRVVSHSFSDRLEVIAYTGQQINVSLSALSALSPPPGTLPTIAMALSVFLACKLKPVTAGETIIVGAAAAVSTRQFSVFLEAWRHATCSTPNEQMSRVWFMSCMCWRLSLTSQCGTSPPPRNSGKRMITG